MCIYKWNKHFRERRQLLLRRFFLFAAIVGVQIAVADEQVAPSKDEELTLAAAVDAAKGNNPMIFALRAKSEAMMHMPDRLASLDDPVLSLSFANVPVDDIGTGNDPMTQIQVGLSQNLPFPGKRKLRKSVATHDAEAAQIDVDEIGLRIVQQVKQEWWQLFYLERALETVQRNQELLRQFVQIAQTKYKVGKGLQQDVLLAQLELSKLLEKDIRLQEARRNSESKLNTLMNRPTLQPIRLENHAEANLPKVKSEDKLQTLAHEVRPLILAAKKRLEASSQRVSLARRERYPDFRIGASYGQRDDRADLASIQVGITLPIYAGTKQTKFVDQMDSEFSQMNYSLQDVYRLVDGDIATTLAKYHSASDQVQLLQGGIIRQAQQTVDSMRAGYQVNQVDFLNLVRAQVTLYDYETQYWQALSAAYQALAQLESVVGQDSIYE